MPNVILDINARFNFKVVQGSHFLSYSSIQHISVFCSLFVYFSSSSFSLSMKEKSQESCNENKDLIHQTEVERRIFHFKMRRHTDVEFFFSENCADNVWQTFSMNLKFSSVFDTFQTKRQEKYEKNGVQCNMYHFSYSDSNWTNLSMLLVHTYLYHPWNLTFSDR